MTETAKMWPSVHQNKKKCFIPFYGGKKFRLCVCVCVFIFVCACVYVKEGSWRGENVLKNDNTILSFPEELAGHLFTA